MENEQEVLDSSTETEQETVNLETTEEVESLDSTEDVEALKQQNRQLFARAKKAEGFKLVDGKWVKPPKEVKTEKPEAKPAVALTDFDKKLEENNAKLLAKIQLDNLDYPEELKKEIEKVAKLQGVSIKQALQDPYIKFKTDAVEKDNKVADAAISRTNRSSSRTAVVPKVDMSTPEGRAAWDKYLAENPDAA